MSYVEVLAIIGVILSLGALAVSQLGAAEKKEAEALRNCIATDGCREGTPGSGGVANVPGQAPGQNRYPNGPIIRGPGNFWDGFWYDGVKGTWRAITDHPVRSGFVIAIGVAIGATGAGAILGGIVGTGMAIHDLQENWDYGRGRAIGKFTFDIVTLYGAEAIRAGVIARGARTADEAAAAAARAAEIESAAARAAEAERLAAAARAAEAARAARPVGRGAYAGMMGGAGRTADELAAIAARIRDLPIDAETLAMAREHLGPRADYKFNGDVMTRVEKYVRGEGPLLPEDANVIRHEILEHILMNGSTSGGPGANGLDYREAHELALQLLGHGQKDLFAPETIERWNITVRDDGRIIIGPPRY